MTSLVSSSSNFVSSIPQMIMKIKIFKGPWTLWIGIISSLHNHFYTSAYGSHISNISCGIHGCIKNMKVIINWGLWDGAVTIIWCSWSWLMYKVCNESNAHVYNVWKQIVCLKVDTVLSNWKFCLCFATFSQKSHYCPCISCSGMWI
jgi:hypothetical protein